MEETNNDCISSFRQMPHVSNVRLLEDKIQHWTEALLWIKEVEMVESVDDLKSSCSVREIQMPNFEVLDAKIALALNRIIHNTQFKRKVSLEELKAQKRTVSFVDVRSLTWSTSTSGSLEPTILSRIMPTYLQLFFEMMIFRNSIRNGTEF